MTNREKQAEEILDIACKGGKIAMKKETGKLCDCNDILCRECGFGISDCKAKLEKWANAEYVEKPKISKRDRAFLEYIKDFFKYIERDEDGALCLSEKAPRKGKTTWNGGGYYREFSDSFSIAFPMVKWEDKEPWLIENLKKLEVVEEYENN